METLTLDEDHRLQYELYEGDVYLHVDVFNWSPSIYKKLLLIFADLQDEFRDAGWKRLRSISPKGPESQLTHMFGMFPVMETEEYYINEVVL